MADAVVSIFLDRLVSLLESEGRQLLEFESRFQETKSELSYMKSYLKDAAKLRTRDGNETLAMVTNDLRELVYDVEDLIADYELIFSKNNGKKAASCHGFTFFMAIKLRRRLGKRLVKVNSSIGIVKGRMISYLATVPIPVIREDESRIDEAVGNPVLFDESEIVGLEDDSAKIREWVLGANLALTTVGIVGMGGIGKTTLAEKVLNSDSVRQQFKHSLLVPVSQSFKLKGLVKKMLKKLNVEEEFLRGQDVDVLMRRLKEELDGRYLIVLDDVWGVDESMWWDSLKSALPRRSGCCIIVTTRNKEVAVSMGAMEKCIHWPKVLLDQDSWSLFKKIAFAHCGGQCPNLELETTGKEIVAKCGGLPLAVKVVAGMMLGKHSVHEWKQISEKLKSELEHKNKDELVISKLQLSYMELPLHLKPCMLCFAMYPEDFEISMFDIIYGWIGEGLVWGRNGKTAYEIGKGFAKELFNRCLIIGAFKDPFERNFYSCKVHDMVRDMLIKIARKDNFLGLDEEGGPTLGSTSRRLGIFKASQLKVLEFDAKLRALICTDIESEEFAQGLCKFLQKQRWLRVFYLSFSTINIDFVLPKQWLNVAGSFVHLVYLNIEKVSLRVLPHSIGDLHKLQIFRLYHCLNLESLPTTISSLKKLSALHIVHCTSLKWLPRELEGLSNLQQLLRFKPAFSSHKYGFQLVQLRSLAQLRELHMNITSKDQIQDSSLNVLAELSELRVLTIDLTGNDGSIEIVHMLSGQLSPFQKLQELWLWNFPGDATPTWLNPYTLPSLQFLYLSRGYLKEVAPSFCGHEGVVWKVEVFVMESLSELEVDWQIIQKCMPLLRLLKVTRCPKLESFPFDVAGCEVWKKEDHDIRTANSV